MPTTHSPQGSIHSGFSQISSERSAERGRLIWILRLILTAAVLASPIAVGAQNTPAPIKVGILLDGPFEVLDEWLQDVKTELAILTEGEFEVVYPQALQRDGQWNYDRINAGLAQLIEHDDVDLVLITGLIGSQIALASEEGFDKPVVALFGIQSDGESDSDPQAGSGIRNLVFASTPQSLAHELSALRNVTQFQNVAVAGDERMLANLPRFRRVQAEQLASLPFETKFIGLNDDVEESLARIDNEVDAVLIYPLLMTRDERQRFIAALTARGIASFSALGVGDVEDGMLATIRRSQQSRQARRTALNIQRVLLGEAPESIPVLLAGRERLVINMATARALDTSIRWDTLLEAEQIQQTTEGLRRLDLNTVVIAAVNGNLDLVVQRIATELGEQEIAAALAAQRPQLVASVLGTQIDSTRAEASFGTNPERTATGSLQLNQILLSEETRANTAAQRKLQLGREALLQQVRLDIALEAAATYLNLLRAKNLLRISQENLALTRANLELAEARKTVGTASAGEVYRWQSQIAQDRQSLISAQSDVRALEITLNRILHNQLEERFITDDVGLGDRLLIGDIERFEGYIATPKHFSLFRDFSVTEGLGASNELAQLDASIAAQQRLLVAQRRSYWLPTVTGQASLDERLAEGGVGADSGAATNDTSWSVALNASLPIFQGGARRAALLLAEYELERLQTQRRALAEQVEEQIRNSSIVARSAFARVALSREAADAATRNLNLVQDAYARGGIDILTLLDAQNAALLADTNANDTVYDFLISVLQVQRAVSRFEFFVDEASREQWFERLNEYYALQGATPWQQ